MVLYPFAGVYCPSVRNAVYTLAIPLLGIVFEVEGARQLKIGNQLAKSKKTWVRSGNSVLRRKLGTGKAPWYVRVLPCIIG